MKTLRVPVEHLVEGEMSLEAEASSYVLRVHRAQLETSLVLFDPRTQEEAEATLVRIQGKSAICEVRGKRMSSAIPRQPLVVLQAFAKGDKVDRVVMEATVLGATQIVIVVTARSVVHLSEEKGPRRRQRWERIAVEAARQCGRGDLPEILGPFSMQEALLHLESVKSHRLVLSLDGAQTLGTWFADRAPSPLAVFIGPEGGFDAAELAVLDSACFTQVRFSQFVLRTETATTAVLGAVAAWHSRAGE